MLAIRFFSPRESFEIRIPSQLGEPTTFVSAEGIPNWDGILACDPTYVLVKGIGLIGLSFEPDISEAVAPTASWDKVVFNEEGLWLHSDIFERSGTDTLELSFEGTPNSLFYIPGLVLIGAALLVAFISMSSANEWSTPRAILDRLFSGLKSDGTPFDFTTTLFLFLILSVLVICYRGLTSDLDIKVYPDTFTYFYGRFNRPPGYGLFIKGVFLATGSLAWIVVFQIALLFVATSWLGAEIYLRFNSLVLSSVAFLLITLSSAYQYTYSMLTEGVYPALVISFIASALWFGRSRGFTTTGMVGVLVAVMISVKPTSQMFAVFGFVLVALFPKLRNRLAHSAIYLGSVSLAWTVILVYNFNSHGVAAYCPFGGTTLVGQVAYHIDGSEPSQGKYPFEEVRESLSSLRLERNSQLDSARFWNKGPVMAEFYNPGLWATAFPVIESAYSEHSGVERPAESDKVAMGRYDFELNEFAQGMADIVIAQHPRPVLEMWIHSLFTQSAYLGHVSVFSRGYLVDYGLGIVLLCLVAVLSVRLAWFWVLDPTAFFESFLSIVILLYLLGHSFFQVGLSRYAVPIYPLVVVWMVFVIGRFARCILKRNCGDDSKSTNWFLGT